ncbi:SNF related kinase b [Denticeps clupeoides]|uniref:SNF-related serine/threonine-protein kinase n=1 Tax=Denticeps clupeoides TaxID=299321 RepID=A0AAY4C3C3_9TELE|nr:SNF-related serine/threonine-protein kinase-like [Denticeps clupeoides]XP_028843362.1 SNF-related serine/threonine-protein kinase-like [Denticeps clupeoides]XP_028843363.1 SNF-related serine/threonine-protein kinase-like [Denticeps clupeoides]
MAATKGNVGVRRESTIAGLYDLLDRTLGKGHFAVVRLARHIFTGQLVAVKVIDKTKLDTLAAGHLLQEVHCMKLVRHPGVVRLYEVIDTQTKLYLVLELADGGDLYDYILRHEGGVNEARAKLLFAQVAHAIAYCHRLHVVHRDLKPENVVFFRQQGVFKLTDFGFSNCFQPGAMLMTSCGSLAYSAPEILLGEEYDAPAVDIWSLGVILYMLVCGHPPFQEANDSETLIMIMDCRYSVPSHISPTCRDLISRMLQRIPSRRASLAEIEGHPWLEGVNPSPAPLATHHSLSADDHELILQAMTSGSIADREAILEALEADRYNHITATYYLLRERVLREKQEQCIPNTLLNPLSEPLELVGGGSERDTPLALLPGCPCRGVSESGDLLAPRTPNLMQSGRHENSTFNGAGPPLGLNIRPAPPDEPPPPAKTIHPLQQICEEEEEEELRESEDPTPLQKGLTKTHMNLETQRGQVSYGTPFTENSGEMKDLLGTWIPETQEDVNMNLSSRTLSKARCIKIHKVATCPVEEMKSVRRMASDQSEEKHQVEEEYEKMEEKNVSPLDSPESQHFFKEAETILEKNNNNPLPKLPLSEKLPSSFKSPHHLPRNHCVDLGPTRLEVGQLPAPAEREQMMEELCLEKPPSLTLSGGADQKDAGLNAPTKADLSAKVKNAKLRERLLQFPLCEKALSFNIQPTSKEKLLPFAQYNCCHVL